MALRLSNLFGLVPKREETSMPRVLISVREYVIYSREVEMTEAEWREWDQKTDQRGRAHDRAVEELTARYIRREQDWQDADQLELMVLSLVLEDARA